MKGTDDKQIENHWIVFSVQIYGFVENSTLIVVLVILKTQMIQHID